MKKDIFIIFSLVPIVILIIGSFFWLKIENQEKDEIRKEIEKQTGELLRTIELNTDTIIKTDDYIEQIDTNNLNTETYLKVTEPDIAETMSMGKFNHPLNGGTLLEDIRIKFEVVGATSVEFYIRRPEALTEIYLGRGSLEGTNLWAYLWRTKSTPNGNYYLIGKVVNDYGEYFAGKIYVSIKNEIVEDIQSESKEDLTHIQIQEDTIIEETQEVQGDLIKEAENLTNQADDILNDDQTQLDVQQKVNEFSKDIPKKIDEAFQNLSEEKQEEVKKNINIHIGEITGMIIKGSDNRHKQEALKLEQETIKNINRLINQLDDIFKKQIEINIQKEELDSDDDGVSDQEESRLGTNPFNSDTDQDGFLDKTEITLGFDPLNPDPDSKIKYEDPRKTETEVSDKFKVDKIEIVGSEEDVDKKVLKIQGKAPPHSFVTIYIYSDPIVVVTKTDANGNWEYILDKPLADGQHSVYATVTNNKGEIDEKSESFDFVKTGQSVFQLFSPAAVTSTSPIDSLHSSFIILIISTIVFALGIAFITVGIFMKQKGKF